MRLKNKTYLLPRTFTLFLITITLGSCSWNKNSDNRIYIPGKEFSFLVQFTDSTGQLLKTDSLKLEVTDGFYPERKQTKIIWTYYQSAGGETTELTNSTGVIDSEEEFFIHPPRVGELYILSFAEFPSLNSKVLEDTTYRYSSEGSITMAKNYEGETITKVKTTQKYNGLHRINIPLRQNILAHQTIATATSETGAITGSYFFHEEYGFVKLLYHLPDHQQVSISLSGVF